MWSEIVIEAAYKIFGENLKSITERLSKKHDEGVPKKLELVTWLPKTDSKILSKKKIKQIPKGFIEEMPLKLPKKFPSPS